MMSSRTLVNAVSLSRIPIAFLFLIFFKQDRNLLLICVGLAVFAFITDIVDGCMARKLRVASVQGRHIDSLSDKAFYIAIIISFHDNGLLGLAVSWGLLVREIALYVSRIVYIDKIDRLDRTRFYTKTHGYFLYAVMFLGFAEMFFRVVSGGQDSGALYVCIQLSAWIALGFGLASILAFMQLK